MNAVAARRPHTTVGFWAFIILMLALTGLFVGLGVWQVQRLSWKDSLFTNCSTRCIPQVKLTRQQKIG